MPEEHRMLQELVAKFVDRDLIPLEKGRGARARDVRPEIRLTEEEEKGLWRSAGNSGFGDWTCRRSSAAPTCRLALVGVYEEQGRTCAPFTFPPDSPNLHMLMAVANDEQRGKYLEPYARGEAHSAIAISEPGAGGDPAGMTTRAVKDGGDWVINGRKIWVSRVPQADFVIVMARTGEGKRARGRHRVHRRARHQGLHHRARNSDARRPAHLRTGVRGLPHPGLAGAGVELGKGFAPMQLRLTVRRLQMGAWSSACRGARWT
jgi:alkylation response protein AidB-like acyl-CoA dehydrogenase